MAIVTGGRRGIGRSIALALAEFGADVAVCDLMVENDQLADVAEEIGRFGRRSLGCPGGYEPENRSREYGE
ncbi:MAG: SDR family NAD(P)-dependent oxidoreductase [Desulfatiglandales bacterium]|nr:SDR family NAD(P)-dependent oxidoreductase [Desulfatiglandales bacterium]